MFNDENVLVYWVRKGKVDQSIVKDLISFILGANGAGKTTTFRMLVRDTEPTRGEILINGRDIVGKAQNSKDDVEIGFCPQFDWLMEDLTVMESLMLFAR